ncbi:MAG: hypothetical protein HYV93_06690 [Candidatus Rokubacteria bacterium]|nr:hypothetical protein [Candidatus Rokubacteria bacterium]
MLEGALGGDQDLVHVHRLEDEVVGAVLEALDGGLHVGHAGEHEDGRVRVQGPGLLEELEPPHHGHVHIGHGERRPLGFKGGQALLAVARGVALVPVDGEELAQDPSHLPVVVNDEDPPVGEVLDHGTRASEAGRASGARSS